MEQTDILVAGAGIAGLTAALRFADAGFTVACVDAAPPPEDRPADLRTTAFLQPSIRLLDALGVWEEMAADGAPLATMRLVDTGGPAPTVRETADFVAEDAGHASFGWNIPNRVTGRVLRAAIAARGDGVSVRHGAGVTTLTHRDADVVVGLGDGIRLAARLVVAADGRASTVRRLSGIGVRKWTYGQKALVFATTHALPHDAVSTEFHRTGGPCTLVPIPDIDGQPASSVVWMMPGPRAAGMMARADADLAKALTAETCGTYGALTVRGPRAVWPIISQIATALTAPRTAILGEAAHVVPPIGAQGPNMSLADIADLAARLDLDDPGAANPLGAWARRRHPEMALRVAGVDMLNRAAMAENQTLRDLRLAGLRTLHRVPPLRHLAMRLGLGT